MSDGAQELDDTALAAQALVENRNTQAWFKPWQPRLTELAEGMRRRDGGADHSLPVYYRCYEYFDRWKRGDPALTHCRRLPGVDISLATELFDENALMRNRPHFDIGDWAVSPCGLYVAWTADTAGDEFHRIFVKRIADGELVDVSPELADAGFEWLETSTPWLAYTEIDDEGRCTRVCLHEVALSPLYDAQAWDEDRVLYEERDPAWAVGVFKSRCERTLFIQSDCFGSNETWMLDASNPIGRLTLVHQREKDVEYYVERQGETLLILASVADEFALYCADIERTSRSDWRPVLRPDSGETIESIEAFRHHTVITRRRGSRLWLEFTDLRDGKRRRINPEQSPGAVELEDNPAFDTQKFRVSFTSPIRGERIFELGGESGKAQLLWEEDAGESYEADDYACVRLWARTHDGELIPISLKYRRSARRPGGSPCLLRVYGSYEEIEDLEFDTDQLGLLDAGVMLGIAHVRGGGEKGRRWYEGGRKENKQNAIDDYLQCVAYLERGGWVSPGAVMAWTESAGAVVAGAALNQKPGAFAGAICEVPFVDMICSLLDEELPTTLADRDEFGDPTNPEELEFLKKISPVDNVVAQDYPPILITLGLNDPRVPAREGFRWARALRAASTSDAPVLLTVDIDAGHHGASGRAREIQRTAELQTFVLACLAKTEAMLD